MFPSCSKFVVSCSSLVFSSSGTCQKGTLGGGPSQQKIEKYRSSSTCIHFPPQFYGLKHLKKKQNNIWNEKWNETIPKYLVLSEMFNQKKSICRFCRKFSTSSCGKIPTSSVGYSTKKMDPSELLSETFISASGEMAPAPGPRAMAAWRAVALQVVVRHPRRGSHRFPWYLLCKWIVNGLL